MGAKRQMILKMMKKDKENLQNGNESES